MRQKILIKSMGDFLFIGSTIEEIIIENAHVHATDLSLVGINAERVHILDTKWNAKKTVAIRRIPTQHVTEFLLQNITINRLVPALFYNHSSVQFDRCKILHLQPAPGLVAQNITKMSFSQCILSHWYDFFLTKHRRCFRHPHALNSAHNIGTIEWSYSSIENIHHHSIYASDIQKLHFHNTHVGILSARAFEQNELQEMTIVESSFKTFGRMAIGRSDIQNLTIDRVEVKLMEDGAFAGINSSLFTINDSKFGQFPAMLFENSFVSHRD
jgi:hypothetical protein